ncbi:hypothetical protein [Streptomyces sp. NPDC051546]|uniref:hypothetical protein n=1 Tax=Streptomyces sp. NPDC051546 TaxID=3365655 RepID=UPI0037A66A49
MRIAVLFKSCDFSVSCPNNLESIRLAPIRPHLSSHIRAGVDRERIQGRFAAGGGLDSPIHPIGHESRIM